ncbi:bifunctional transcriptional activator/DNA repair enzyme AdaA [Fodinibius saliphilus]|uniref:bifunctional transcriptional activator/DNA repair enzyme AdaA n=1 Tax=Fodinibius saliphilus TaxID=1920650 RepID=UPI001BB2AE6A|nr:methylated-DNA--[protein]-cysteine S-methyltransferase [Fodinibius saliphilus]
MATRFTTMINYERVGKAIKYINEHANEQPNLDDIAEAINLSPYHFHRMFKKWAGITPKKFLQYISINHAKEILQNDKTIAEATFQTGLSSSSRLHDLFVKIEGMTPGEYKEEGKALNIHYQFGESLFGPTLIASTGKGICHLSFVDDEDRALKQLAMRWANARIGEAKDEHIENLQHGLTSHQGNLNKVKAHIRGTDFQLKVWEALLKIPVGQLASYSDVARAINKPKASRAVGTALANNPVAYLIPCHRVIRKVGKIGQYRWGSTRKQAIIGWELAASQRS